MTVSTSAADVAFGTADQPLIVGTQVLTFAQASVGPK
jgi:hypothetical protein